ncbi:hypothetical protein GLOIN_2v1779100 [Rhizophagus irregularis DAOM 181602=DAOM 197198]|uniref:Uncharacterized protein n=1 Tax=Rhizophagus irregularis (strain DAOM 181602 / DAOM 197198 / MUCL 43194) TaxID=747089 RepID=U9T8M5_RHIID|nr:hypothetical protein GLOIN_2v1779100 [Rhizophagus irregularis DAOM 181602=DAOM 197198]
MLNEQRSEDVKRISEMFNGMLKELRYLLLSCKVEGYINIYVRSQLKRHELEKAGLISIEFAELCQAYDEELNVSEHLASRKDKYYKSASYTIVDNDDNDQIDVKLKVGYVIDVLEDL